MHSPLLDINQAARQLGIAPKTLYKWVERGLVPVIKIGRMVRFREKDLEEWIEHQLHDPAVPIHRVVVR